MSQLGNSTVTLDVEFWQRFLCCWLTVLDGISSHHCLAVGCTSSTNKWKQPDKYSWMHDVDFFAFPKAVGEWCIWCDGTFCGWQADDTKSLSHTVWVQCIQGDEEPKKSNSSSTKATTSTVPACQLDVPQANSPDVPGHETDQSTHPPRGSQLYSANGLGTRCQFAESRIRYAIEPESSCYLRPFLCHFYNIYSSGFIQFFIWL